MPRIEKAQHAECDHAEPTENDKDCLIYSGILFTEFEGDGNPILGICLHVPYIVHIEDTYAEKAYGASREKEYP